MNKFIYLTIELYILTILSSFSTSAYPLKLDKYTLTIKTTSVRKNLFNYFYKSSKKGSECNYELKSLKFTKVFTKRQLRGISFKWQNNKIYISKTLEQFGAKGDGISDDTQAIIKAFSSPVPMIYARKTKAFYRVSTMIVITNIQRKKIIATGARFLNTDTTKATFLFQDSKNIEIQGGSFGYEKRPTANGGNSQHVFQFDRCQNILVNKIHISSSPEMGVAITNSNHVIIQNSFIEHTFRDGTYAHYSANVKYLNNIYSNIKDDAMSFHDYGISSEKIQLLKYGYKRATNLTASGNTVKNSYQGFSSVAADRVQVINNKIMNTVLAGISIFNAKEMFPGSTAFSSDIKILYNTINNSCKTTSINGKKYENYGQLATGRAAIFIGSLGDKNQINQGETKRLSNVIIKGNKVTNSGAHCFWGSYVDSLNFTNNNFVDCSGAIPAQFLTGDAVEISNTTKFYGYNNAVIDDRSKVQHRHGYAINNVTGRMGKWKVRGFVTSQKSMPTRDSLHLLINQLR